MSRNIGDIPINQPLTLADVAGCAAALDEKSDAGHGHDGMYSDALHNHDGVYAPLSHSHPYQPSSEKGQPDGYPSLDSAGKVPTSQLPAAAGGVQMIRKGADQNFTSTAYADVTGLSLQAQPNTDYAFEFLIVWSAAATTTGAAFALNGPASPAMFSALVETALTATTFATRQDTAYDQGTATASIDAANTNRVCRIKGVLRTGAAGGSLTVRCKSEVAGSAITVKRGSFGTWF